VNKDRFDTKNVAEWMNPFAVTKAVDFTDKEIKANWVDWPQHGGFATWLNVKSPTPRIIVGGKGTGRTHLMRHFSAPVQAIRSDTVPLDQVVDDGILGIYVLCSGLNSSRFRGRGQNDETWEAVFSHYMDVWLAQAALDAFSTIATSDPLARDVEASIAAEIAGYIDFDDRRKVSHSLDAIQDELFAIQREMDRVINDAALTPERPIHFTLTSNPAELVFGVPEAIRKHYQPLENVLFLYLIDELENFAESQQRYVNSLIREKRPGTSFMVGVRTYGLRTYATLTPGEENRRGSEFDEIRQDRKYTSRRGRRRYADFCDRVVARRLTEHGLMDEFRVTRLKGQLDAFFETAGRDHVERLVSERFAPDERPHLLQLRQDLGRHWAATTDEVDQIVGAVAVESSPLLEKVNILFVYRAWRRGRDLTAEAGDIARGRVMGSRRRTVNLADYQKTVLEYYGSDLQAQLYRDLGRSPVYAGMREFIAMSHGLPRNLLVTLKNIYRWAAFSGERPFRSGKISLEAQRLGVLEAAEWFFRDAKPMGTDGDNVHDAIGRLGDMFRMLRFSTKPVESSLASFSADLTSCSRRARAIIELAEQWALLVRVDGGQKERNSGLAEAKFELNRLLSPRWDLPTARRGAIRLSAIEVNAIFDPEHAIDFSQVVDVRLRRMNPPFGRGRRDRGPVQGALKIAE